MNKDKKNKRILFIIIAIIIIILLLLGLRSCSSSDSNSGKNNTANKLESNKKPSNTNKKEDLKVESTQKEDANKPSSDKKEDSKKPSTQANTATKPTQQPTSQNTTSKPNTKPSVKPQPNTPSHTHNWVAQYKTIHHDAQGHNEKVCVKEAWDEQIEQIKQEKHCICNGCGLDLTANNIEPWKHVKDSLLSGGNCGGHHTAMVNVGTYIETIHHDAVYENKWVVDKEAYDEKVLDGYKCSSCGATK